jgi:hypothetical protein
MSKYQPLGDFLVGQDQRKKWCAMRFDDIEEILKFPLPPSARRHRGWWTNDPNGTHVQARAWMGAGWRVWRADLSAENVEFERTVPTQGDGLSEDPVPYRYRGARLGAADPITFDRAKLSVTARRILDDYTAELGGNVQAAIDRALHEARVAYRRRLIDSIVRTSPPSSVSSVDLIREDRDAR